MIDKELIEDLKGKEIGILFREAGFDGIEKDRFSRGILQKCSDNALVITTFKNTLIITYEKILKIKTLLKED